MVWGRKKKKYEEDEDDEEEENEQDAEEEAEQKIAKTSRQDSKPVIVEREVTLSLLNEKLNYLISKVQE